jgi:pimeloyl-ACP methyl ester carboxylesterase
MRDTADEGARAAGGPDLGAMLAAVASGASTIDPGLAIAFLQPLVLSKSFIEANKAYLREVYERTASYGFSTDGFAGQIAAVLGHDTTARLATIGAPTLVVVGGGDRLVPPAATRKLAQLVPNARLVEIPGAPHGMNLERSAEVNVILEGWLAEHDQG